MLYWRYGEYAGIGPGAHGRLMHDGTRYALSALRDPAAWAARVEAQGHGLEAREMLTRHEQAEEFLLMGMRLGEGLRLDRLAALTGHAIAASSLAPLIEAGLLQVAGNGRLLKSTPQGRLLLNSLIAELAKGLGPAEPSHAEVSA